MMRTSRMARRMTVLLFMGWAVGEVFTEEMRVVWRRSDGFRLTTGA